MLTPLWIRLHALWGHACGVSQGGRVKSANAEVLCRDILTGFILLKKANSDWLVLAGRRLFILLPTIAAACPPGPCGGNSRSGQNRSGENHECCQGKGMEISNWSARIVPGRNQIPLLPGTILGTEVMTQLAVPLQLLINKA